MLEEFLAYWGVLSDVQLSWGGTSQDEDPHLMLQEKVSNFLSSVFSLFFLPLFGRWPDID